MYSQAAEAKNAVISFPVNLFISIQKLFTESQRKPDIAHWNLELLSTVLHGAVKHHYIVLTVALVRHRTGRETVSQRTLEGEFALTLYSGSFTCGNWKRMQRRIMPNESWTQCTMWEGSGGQMRDHQRVSEVHRGLLVPTDLVQILSLAPALETWLSHRLFSPNYKMRIMILVATGLLWALNLINTCEKMVRAKKPDPMQGPLWLPDWPNWRQAMNFTFL